MNLNPLVFAALAALAPAAAAAAPSTAGNAFNPAISLILDGRLASYSNDPEDYALPGFQLGPEVGPGERGFALGEAELNLSANIDDSLYGNLIVALHSHDGGTEVELEEAWIQTTALPHGFTLKAGKLFSRIGYLNEKHPHAWDFADAPLAHAAFFAGNLKDTGLQARWLAPTALFFELGVEAFAGDAFPAAGRARGGRGSYAMFAKLGGDLDASHSWQVGVSALDARAEGRSAEPHDPASEPTVAFTGTSRLYGADLVWKWAPDGNYRSRNLVLVAEWMRRSEEGELAVLFPPATAPEAGSYAGEQDGAVVQAVWQWRPRWRVGLRQDRLVADNAVAGLSGPIDLADDARAPTRSTLMVDWSRSEFTRFRLQLARDASSASADHQVILQYLVSMGPHGAHQF